MRFFHECIRWLVLSLSFLLFIGLECVAFYLVYKLLGLIS